MHTIRTIFEATQGRGMEENDLLGDS